MYAMRNEIWKINKTALKIIGAAHRFIHRTNRILTFFIILSLYADATDEFIQVKVFNPRFQASHSVMCAMLKRADLEDRGYKREVITKSVQKSENNKPDFEASHYVRIFA